MAPAISALDQLGPWDSLPPPQLVMMAVKCFISAIWSA